MKSKGRPATKPAKLMDGYYIEVRNKGSKEKGVKIRSVTREEMEVVAKQYARMKEVIILGEHKDEVWVNQVAEKKAAKKAAKAKSAVLN